MASVARLRLRTVGASQGGGPNLMSANIFGALQSVPPQSYTNPGVGNPAVSMADYYHVDGMYAQFYDLTQFGATGASIATNCVRS